MSSYLRNFAQERLLPHTLWFRHGLKHYGPDLNARNGFSQKAYKSEDGSLPQKLVEDFSRFYDSGVGKNIFRVPQQKA